MSGDEGTLGHNGLEFSVDLNRAKVDPNIAPVINSHAIAEGRDGLLYLVTDHPKAAYIVLKKDGTFVRSFGEGLVGGHGLEIFEKNGEEYVIHVDCGWHFEAAGWNAHPSNGRITILKTEGTIANRLPTPFEMGIGEAGDRQFMPCDVAVTPKGTVLIADGYASDLVYEMTMDGALVKRWGAPKEDDPNHLQNAHGISLDLSGDTPLVWVPSRAENKIKAFTLEGDYVETINLPGAFAGQLFFRGDKIYTAVCWSKENGVGKRLSESGFLLIMDRETKRVLSAPGGSEPVYVDGELQPLYQTSQTFVHGHDLYVDSDGAIYIGEWNANRRYPAKLSLSR
ncbi:MAG: 6-bladed beta-propeller [Opitutaceae bacterium]|nr:6-bladed beta-propeller [Opitutaceae bacterium]